MGAAYTRHREEVARKKEASRCIDDRIQRHNNIVTNLYYSKISKIEFDELKANFNGSTRALIDAAWENGKESRVTCDGTGKGYGLGGKRCAISWVVVHKGGPGGQCVVMCPRGTGGCIYRDDENPRIKKRDFCNTCAKAEKLTTTQILIGPADRVVYDLPIA